MFSLDFAWWLTIDSDLQPYESSTAGQSTKTTNEVLAVSNLFGMWEKELLFC